MKQFPCHYVGQILLAEVALEQALESLAVTGLVARHLVYGVMDGIQAQFLGQLGQIGLASGRAVLGVNAHLQVLLGGVGHDLAQQLGKLGRMLSLFMRGLLYTIGGMGILYQAGYGLSIWIYRFWTLVKFE